MATTNLGMGTTVDFIIPLPQSIEDLHNVLVELYVNEDKPVRFSYLPISGQNSLVIGGTNLELKGKLLSKYTAKMKGCLFMRLEVQTDATEATENIGNSLSTDTTIIFA